MSSRQRITWGSTSVTQKLDPHVESSESEVTGLERGGVVFTVLCLDATLDGDSRLFEEVDGCLDIYALTCVVAEVGDGREAGSWGSLGVVADCGMRDIRVSR